MEKLDLKIFDIKDSCTGCLACVTACPVKCIHPDYDEEGFWIPVMAEPDKCIHCHKCERVCHVISNSPDSDQEEPVWWNESTVGMFRHHKEDVRAMSTSGGAMTMLSQYIMKQNGVVYCSMYDGDHRRLQFSSSDEHDLSLFRKSRYFESYTGNIFNQVKKSLEQARKVLFIGSPCQVRGLKSFLGPQKDSPNLLTVNFVCHGVPSNEIFHLYVKSKYGINHMNNVDSRYQDATHGWHSTCIKIDSCAGKKVIPYSHDGFHMAFLKNEYLRRCCYSCRYLFGDSADITIGDFWGIGKFAPEKDDNKGMSLIILHTHKALSLKNIVLQEGIWTDIPFQSIDYLLRESKSKDIKTRFKGSKKEYLKYLLRHYQFIIWRNKLKSVIKSLIGR